jgi:hypothetical protein
LDCFLTQDAAKWADENAEIRAVLDKSDAAIDDWNLFRRRFLERFGGNTNERKFIDPHPVQLPTETLYQFSERMVGKFHAVGAHDDAQEGTPQAQVNVFTVKQHIDMFLRGINDKSLSYKVGELGPKTLADAASHAVRLEQFYAANGRSEASSRGPSRAPSYAPSRHHLPPTATEAAVGA